MIDENLLESNYGLMFAYDSIQIFSNSKNVHFLIKMIWDFFIFRAQKSLFFWTQ